MRAFNRNTLSAALVVLVLAACSTTPEATDTTTTDEDFGTQATTQETETTNQDTDSSTVTAVSESDSPVISASEAALLAARTVYFDFDKSNIKPDSFQLLKAHAAYLAARPGASVRLEGHCDERGTREYNVALGERRGVSVAKFLRVNGVSDSQIEVVSYGEEKPAVYGSTESAYAKNRRVEISYTSGKP